MTPTPPPGFELIPSTPPPPPGFEVIQPPGYTDNLKNMATEGAEQLGRGVAQLHNAWDFAASGAGRNVVPDTPVNRVAGGFSAMNPLGPQAPLTASEHQAGNRQAVGDLVSGFGNTVSGALGAAYSPVNAALKTYVGQPVEQATGSKGAGLAAELAAGFFGPSILTRGAAAMGRMMAAKPSGQQIHDAAAAGFNSPVVRNLGINPSATQSWSQTVRSDLTRAGLDDMQAANVWRTLDRLDNVPAGATVTGNNLQSIRASLGNMAKERGSDFQPTPNAEAARRSIDALDNFVAGMGPRDVVAGNPQQAAAVWNEARANWAQYAKIRAADRRQIQAEGQNASAHSAMNFDNSVRQKMRDVAVGPEGRSFNLPGERQAVEQTVFGSPERNTLRVGSAMLGGGGGIGTSIVGGGAALASGNPWALVAIPAGLGMRATQNALAGRDLDRLSAVLSANSPLARQQGGARQDIARALMGAELPGWARNTIAAQLLSRP